MRVYEVTYCDDHRDIDCRSLEEEREFFERFDDTPFCGQSLKEHWGPLHMVSPENEANPLTDFVFIGVGAFAFSTTLLPTVTPLLEDFGELLPLTINDRDFCVFNITNIQDIIDHSNADFRYASDGRIMGIITAAVCIGSLTRNQFFKLPLTSTSSYLAEDSSKGDSFRELYEEHGFTGLRFKEIATSL